jgi:hypothetical protein
MLRVRRWTGVSPFGASGIVFSNFWRRVSARIERRECSRHTNLSNTHLLSLRSSDRQFQSCWLWFSRHCQWVRNSARQFSLMSLILSRLSIPTVLYWTFRQYVHASRTPGDLAAFLHAVKLSPAVGLSLAHHVVIVVGLASCANEERGTQEGRRTGSELFDLGDVVG